jgi:predicted GTPase
MKAFDRFKEQTLYVVVCGECTRGKSSTVNMLLDEPGPLSCRRASLSQTRLRSFATERRSGLLFTTVFGG